MNESQTAIYNLATSLGLTADSDTDAIAAAVDAANAPTVDIHDTTLIGMAATIMALASAGHDPDKVIEALESTPTGRRGVDKLTSAGLDYGHPVTLSLLSARVADGSISRDVMDTLVGLSVRYVSPAADAGLTPVTVDQIRDALTARRDDEIAAAAEVTLARKRGMTADTQIAVSTWLADHVAATRAETLAEFDAALSAEGWD